MISFSALFLFIFQLHGQVSYFQGTIAEDTVFETDTVKVTGDIFVLNGVTLSIKKGVVMEFQGYYKMDIKGRLIAIGEISDTIEFTVNNTSGFADTSVVNGSWAGIRFDQTDENNDTSFIKFCKFMYGKKIGSDFPENAGGAVFIDNFSKVVISNSTFCHNISIKYGAGIYCGRNSSPIIEDCTFYKNVCYHEGGGIYLGVNSNAKVYNSQFYENRALITGFDFGFYWGYGSGGGIYSSSADLNSACPEIINNRFFNNISVNGAGIYESNHNIKIINNLICNNNGTGIMNGHQKGKGLYINNTLCNNSYHGGIISNSIYLRVINCIIWGNTNTMAGEDSKAQIVKGYGGAPKVTYSNVQFGYNGTGNIDTFPMFSFPSEGPGALFNGKSADWSLQNDSPCKDIGIQDTTGLSIPESDILWNPRIINGRIDLGAIENQFYSYTSNVEQHYNIKVYPNPASIYINVEINTDMPLSISLFNANGVCVLEQKAIESGERLNLHNIPQGVYFYTIYLENKQISKGVLIIE